MQKKELGGYKPRIEVNLKMQKSWGRGGCEQRIEVLLEMKKKFKSGSGGCDSSRAGGGGGQVG